MKANELRVYLEKISEELMRDAAEIVAATATDYYRESFRRKGFDGVAWTPAKAPKTRGTLLITSGALAGSIIPAIVTPQRVVISAGNSKVNYAKVHNEGFSGRIAVPEHVRKTKFGEVAVRPHTRHTSVIQRQFMGQAGELDRRILERLQGYINYKTK